VFGYVGFALGCALTFGSFSIEVEL